MQDEERTFHIAQCASLPCGPLCAFDFVYKEDSLMRTVAMSIISLHWLCLEYLLTRLQCFRRLVLVHNGRRSAVVEHNASLFFYTRDRQDALDLYLSKMRRNGSVRSALFARELLTMTNYSTRAVCFWRDKCLR